MDIDEVFPTKPQTVDDLPEAFRSALKNRISPCEGQYLLIYSPAFSALNELPATVLAVLKDRWLVATEDDNGVRIQQSTFNETLCLELSSTLLSGELKIFFASTGRHYGATIAFNDVREDVYREAVNLILDGIDASPSVKALPDDRPQTLVNGWPMNYQLKAQRYQPVGQSLVTATRWNAVTNGFERKLSPAGALLVTARTLVSILDQEPAVQQPQDSIRRFGGIVTYLPIARLSDFEISHHGRFGILELRLQAPHGHEQLEYLFPSDREKAITKTVACAFLSKHEV